jgi:hypothetical protein
VIRLQQVHTPDGEHIIETEFPSEFDLSGNRPVLKRYKRVSDRLLLRVSLKIWPHGTTTGQWITFRATVERARSNTPYYLKSKGYYFARAEKIMIKKIQSRKLIV